MAKKKAKTKAEPSSNIQIFAPGFNNSDLEKLLQKTEGEKCAPAINVTQYIDSFKELNTIYKMRKSWIYDTKKGKEITDKDFPEPPWDEDLLLDFVKYNAYHYTCMSIKSEDAIRPGMKFKHATKPSGARSNHKIFLETFFDKKRNDDGKSFSDVAVDMLMDLQRSCGRMCCAVKRNRGRKISQIKHISAYRIRPHKYCFNNKEIGEEVVPIFRYIIDPSKRKYWYFKKFGVKEEYDAETGEPFDKSEGHKFPAQELIYITTYEPGSGEGYNQPYSPFYGLPVIIPALTASIGFYNQRLFNIKFFKSTIKNLIMISGQLSPEYKQYLKEFIESYATDEEMLSNLFAQSDNPEAKIHIQPILEKAIEASFLEFFTQTRDEIVTAHKIPPYRVSIYETGKLAGNLAQQANEIYKDTSLAPLQRLIEDMANQFIIGGENGFGISDWSIKFNRLDTADHKYLLDLVCRMLDRSALTLNQGLNILGIDSDLGKEGDKRIILSTYVPFDVFEKQTEDGRLPNSQTPLIHEKEPKDSKDVIPELNKEEK